MLLHLSTVLILYNAIPLLQAETLDRIGEPCTLRNQQQGECVAYNECKTIRRNALPPPLCTVGGLAPIVCCSKTSDKPISKTEEKCQEWMDTPLPEGTILPNAADDKFAPVIEYSPVAALGYGEKDDIKWLCGGTLISEKFILTAAHCLSSKSYGDVKYVRLGTLNVIEYQDDGKPEFLTYFTIYNKTIHPKYKPPLQYHDIALLELFKPIRFTRYVWPACLQTAKEIEVDTFTATGYGKLGHFDNLSLRLHKKDLAEMPNAKCSEFYKNKLTELPEGILQDSQLCVFGDKTDNCQDDYAGPLLISNTTYRGIKTIVGVTSLGKACGISDTPAVYTRVSQYISWIESIVWPN